MGALALAAVSTASTSNPGAIAISTSAYCGSAQCLTTATPYPSTINVSGGPASITNVTVTILGLSHPHPDDLDVALVGPNGSAVKLMSDVGGDFTVDQDLTFDDNGAVLPDAIDISNVAGPYKPTDDPNTSTSCPDIASGTPADVFPSGPSTFASTLGAAFGGSNSNGDWKLDVVDDCAGGAGSIDSGWSLTLSNPTVVTLRSFVARAKHRRVTLHWTTASEADVVGFNVYRFGGTSSTRVNRVLILAKGGGPLRGATYGLLDRTARPGMTYTYRLEVVSSLSKRSWQGFARVRAK
jgi:subtilisin-like proprotein convertase family protein